MKRLYPSYKKTIACLLVFVFSASLILAQDVVINPFSSAWASTYNAGQYNEVVISGSLATYSGSFRPSCDENASPGIEIPRNQGGYLQALTTYQEIASVTFTCSSNGSSGTGCYAWSTDGVTWIKGSFAVPERGSTCTPTVLTAPDVRMKYFRVGTGGELCTSASSNSNIRMYAFSLTEKIGTPYLTASLTSLSGLTYVVGTGPSIEKTFSLTGVNLAQIPIIITAPANFEVSSDGKTYGSTATIANAAGGTLAATTLYVRLAEGVPIGNYTGNITVSGGGVTLSTPTIALSGTVSSGIITPVCNASSSVTVNLATEDFGTFTSETGRDRSAYVGSTFTYATGGISDLFYAVIAKSGPTVGRWAVIGYDHTSATTTYPVGTYGGMLMVNCGATAGKVMYSREFTVCAGASLEFSAWYADANAHANGGYLYTPNMTFKVYGKTGSTFTLIPQATAISPTLPLVESVTPIWHKITSNFSSGGYTTIKLEITNNVNQTDGNDILIDDIQFNAYLPNISICQTDIPCNGGSNGIITVSASMGSYTYKLDGANALTGTSAIYNGLTGGQHIINIQDASSLCTYDVPITLAQPPAVTVTATTPPPICWGTSSLQVTVSGGNPGYTYSLNNGNWVKLTNLQEISGLAQGPYSIAVKDAMNCSGNTLNGTVAVAPASDILTLTSTAATTHQEVCADNASITPITYTFGGTATGVTLTGLPAGVTSSVTGSTVTISGTATATGAFNYKVTTTNVSGFCFNEASGTITIHPIPVISLTSNSTTTNQILCGTGNPISPITYSLSGSATGASINGLPNGVNYNVSAGVLTISGTPTVVGTYNYSVSTTGQISPCGPATANGVIDIKQVPVISMATPSALCEGSPLIFAVTPATLVSYEWTINNTIDASQTGNIYTVPGTAAAGTVNVSVTAIGANGCKSLPAVTNGTINPIPPIPTVHDYVGCQAEGQVQWNSLAQTAAGTVNWYASSTDATPITPTNVSKSLVGTSTLYAGVTSPAGCKSEKVPVNVTISSNPVISSIDKNDVKNIGITVTQGLSPYNYTVGAKSGTFTDFANLGLLPFGINQIIVSDANNCQASSIFYIDPVPLITMQYFSPNNDGQNDIWLIENTDFYPRLEVQIFDRYGKELVHYTPTEFVGWNGIYNGRPLPADDYWYVIKIPETGSRQAGHFNLKR